MNQKVEFSSIAVHLTRPSSDSSIGLTVWSEGDHEAQSHDSASIFKRLKEHGVCAVLPPTSDLKEFESRTEALRRLIEEKHPVGRVTVPAKPPSLSRHSLITISTRKNTASTCY